MNPKEVSMSKKRIKMISIIVAVALAVGVGGLVYAYTVLPSFDHTDQGGHKLIGVGETGLELFGFYGEGSIDGPSGYYHYDGEVRNWDTQFIITNPNCEQYIDIEWVALIAGEDTCDFDPEEVIFEGTPEDWDYCPGISIPYDLSGHEVWHVSLAELLYAIEDGTYAPGDPEYDEDLYYFISGLADVNRFTLEVVWTGVDYGGWWGWRDWQGGRPLIGWQKEKCRYITWGSAYEQDVEFPGLTISEAPMEVFPGCNDFSGESWCDSLE
jgi:hypothetical protein